MAYVDHEINPEFSVSIPIPSGASLDVLVALTFDIGASPFPTGYTGRSLSTVPSTGFEVRCITKTRDVGDVTGANHTFDSNDTYPIIHLLDLSGVEEAPTITPATGTSTTATAPSVATGGAAGTLVCYFYALDVGLSGTPTGMTARGVGPGTDARSWTEEISAGGGDTGTRSMTLSGSAPWVAIAAFFPAAGGGGGGVSTLVDEELRRQAKLRNARSREDFTPAVFVAPFTPGSFGALETVPARRAVARRQRRADVDPPPTALSVFTPGSFGALTGSERLRRRVPSRRVDNQPPPTALVVTELSSLGWDDGAIRMGVASVVVVDGEQDVPPPLTPFPTQFREWESRAPARRIAARARARSEELPLGQLAPSLPFIHEDAPRRCALARRPSAGSELVPAVLAPPGLGSLGWLESAPSLPARVAVRVVDAPPPSVLVLPPPGGAPWAEVAPARSWLRHARPPVEEWSLTALVVAPLPSAPPTEQQARHTLSRPVRLEEFVPAALQAGPSATFVDDASPARAKPRGALRSSDVDPLPAFLPPAIADGTTSRRTPQTSRRAGFEDAPLSALAVTAPLVPDETPRRSRAAARRTYEALELEPLPPPPPPGEFAIEEPVQRRASPRPHHVPEEWTLAALVSLVPATVQLERRGQLQPRVRVAVLLPR
jgi:hypothetical protein